MRLPYPDTIRIIRLPCTGKVDAVHIMEAFEKGADGVYVAGCLEGECHFIRGNLRAKSRVEYRLLGRCTKRSRPWAPAQFGRQSETKKLPSKLT